MKQYKVEFETAELYDAVKVRARSRSHAKSIVKAHYNGLVVITGVQPCKAAKVGYKLISALTGCSIFTALVMWATHLYINGLGW